MAKIILHAFDLPNQAHMARLLLESEDIEVTLMDELTVQTLNFYSTAVGGVKLLVEEEVAEKAYHVLLEAGYIIEDKETPSAFTKALNRFLNKLANLGTKKEEAKNQTK